MMDGIAAVYGPKDKSLVEKVFDATDACKHRGDTASGIAIGNKDDIYTAKGLGMLDVTVDEEVKAPLPYEIK